MMGEFQIQSDSSGSTICMYMCVCDTHTHTHIHTYIHKVFAGLEKRPLFFFFGTRDRTHYLALPRQALESLN